MRPGLRKAEYRGKASVGSPFTIRERVRWIDCDAAQIIHYGSYIRFFEIAETEMYRSVGLPYAVAFEELNCFRSVPPTTATT